MSPVFHLIVNNVLKIFYNQSSVVDQDDLRQTAYLAILNINRKFKTLDDEYAYLYRVAYNAVWYERIKMFKCFTLSRHTANNLCKYRTDKLDVDSKAYRDMRYIDTIQKDEYVRL